MQKSKSDIGWGHQKSYRLVKDDIGWGHQIRLTYFCFTYYLFKYSVLKQIDLTI